MSLKDQLTVDTTIFTNVADFGEMVVWHSKNGMETDLPMLFHHGMIMVAGQLVAIENEATVIFAAALIEPGAGDYFTRAGGDIWKIDRNSPFNSDGVYWRIKAVRDRLAVLRS